MSGNRYIRRGSRAPQEPKIGRMFLVSLGLHLLVFLIFSGALVFTGDRDRRPVYYVDLTQAPVAKPQAGRPDARPKPTKQAPKKTVQKTVKKTVKQAPVKKTVSKPPEAVKSTAPAISDAEIQKKLDALRREREREELKQKLAALAAGDSRDDEALGSDVPLGEPEGQGDEVGISQLRWLEEFIKANWSLSRYQVSRTDVEASAWVIYSSEGRLVDFSLQEASGERVFDDSIKKAILKSNQLSFEPQFANQKITITFNLKDLLER